MQWLAEHSAALSLVTNAAMLVVWISYLNIFLFSFLRQRRQLVTITQGAGAELKAKCFVSNLGLEPIYIVEVVVDLMVNGKPCQAVVTDRTLMTDHELEDPREATNQGPLQSGRHSSIGEFEDLVRRGLSASKREGSLEDVSEVTITVVTATAAKGAVTGSRRAFVIEGTGEDRILHGRTLMAEQITGRAASRKLRRDLEVRLGIG
ncbi:hypothetical protein [Limimaricola cinnabarinus]|uniref:Uncharacterized protein n=1 Tax=Limimaricola cinnabarinus TaxID=1125964 RepID=A0A2G1MJ41_9RHOB|nr:hypothetical protein [Limimaricola cinnabarinus]PHP28660.1 hypothetical protein CJ301_05520 [Limimaricola cinnabarinus]